MELKSIKISDLQVNRSNDRHGELEHETAAIAWLFRNHERHMKNLARDIAEMGKVYEPPLVFTDKGNFVVLDGNRRVTCLKLLDHPSKAPTTDLQRYFEKLRCGWKGSFPESIQCWVERDRDTVDEILYRRHTGTLEGVGQSKWNDRMKDNFVTRTGKKSGFNVADEIESRLEDAGMLPDKKIPRSNINRFFSAEEFRSPVGFSVRKKKWYYTHHPDEVLKALQKIANDFAYGAVVLGDIWNSSGKRKYLDRLDREGFLPEHDDVYEDKDSSTNKQKPRDKSSRPRLKPQPQTPKNTTLIPQEEFGIEWTGEMERHRAIWEELQFHLSIEKHPNAISVLFRVLLEISIEHYIDKENLPHLQNKNLAYCFQSVGERLVRGKKIDKKEWTKIKKFRDADQLISADTFNKYVHAKDFAPSPEHLKVLWGGPAPFILASLKK